MGLACTLLGHRYGDVELEHDREERGEEVVTVTREVATCERCGREHVLSETTEVTAIVDPDDVADAVDDDAGTGAGADADAGAGSDPGGERSAADGTGDTPTADADVDVDVDGPRTETTGGTDAGRATPEDATRVPEPDRDPDTTPDGDVDLDLDPDPDPDDDDAVILDDDDRDQRDFGEWPDADTDIGIDTAADDGDGEDGGDRTDAETEAAAREAEEQVFEEIDPAADLPDALHCSGCGFRTGAQGTPLRAGDACPDCGDAYLVAEGGEGDGGP